MIPPEVAISHHAWRQFIERHRAFLGGLPKCPANVLRRLMAVAEPEDLGGGNVLRMLDNGLEPAQYFCAEGWRFVVNEAGTMVLTIERVIHKKKAILQHKKKRGKRPWS